MDEIVNKFTYHIVYIKHDSVELNKKYFTKFTYHIVYIKQVLLPSPIHALHQIHISHSLYKTNCCYYSIYRDFSIHISHSLYKTVADIQMT